MLILKHGRISKVPPPPAMADDFPEDSFFRNSNVAVLEAALQEKENDKNTTVKDVLSIDHKLTGAASQFVTAKQLLISRSNNALSASVPEDEKPEESEGLVSSNQSSTRLQKSKRKATKSWVNRNTKREEKAGHSNEEDKSNDTQKMEVASKDKNKSSYRPLNITRSVVVQGKQNSSSTCNFITDYVAPEDSSSLSSSNLAEESNKNSSSFLSTQQKLKLDVWGLPQSILEQYARRGITEMFRWQVECLCCPRVLNGGNLIYSAPTSAGKTLVSEIVCIKTILERRKKVIFVLPFVSVVREKMFYFKEIFRGSKVRVDGYMGGYSPPGGFQMLDLAICTIEKANSLVNRLMEENELMNLGAVVVDELHLIGDPHRGYLLELLLTKLKYMSLRNDLISIQLVGMSATLPNLSLLSSWLDADLYKTSFRPVPLEEHIKVGNILYDSNLKPVRTIEPELEIKNDTEDIVYLCLETICNGHSVLIFCPTKAWCESLAQTIASELRTIGLGRDVNAPDSMAFKLREQLNAARIGECLEQLRSSPVGLDNMLGKVISFGVAYHHAGLSLDERDIVEGSFKSGTLRVLVATTTLSSGVNLPARRVIIRSPVFQGRSIDILSYRQMVGRAGRMGVDSAGESILVCQKTERRIVANLVGSSLKPIESCLGHGDLAASLKRAVLEVIASGVASTPEDLQVYTNCTLLASGREETEKDNNPLSSCITFLEHNELIRLQTGDDKILRYTPTPLGQACLSASIHPDEGLRLFKELQRARQCFVLENELHLVYQVTPFNVADQWGNLDWLQVLALWEQLTPDMKRVGELVGVEDRFIVRAMRGTVNLKLEKQCQKLMVHRRFYAALALHDLVNEVPLNTVATKFNCSRGMLQSLQQSAATYAGMVTSFCHRLGWSSVELLVHQFQDRLHFGTHRELLDLLRLPSLNGPRARALYNAGITSVSELTSADILAVENALYSAIPFLSDKGRDGETASEIERRKKLKGIWITGRQGLSEREAADLLIKEARSIIQAELGLTDVNWDQKKHDHPSNTEAYSVGQRESSRDQPTASNVDAPDQKKKDEEMDACHEIMPLPSQPEEGESVRSKLEVLDYAPCDSLEDTEIDTAEHNRNVNLSDLLASGTDDAHNLKNSLVEDVQESFGEKNGTRLSFVSLSKNASADLFENNICDTSNLCVTPSNSHSLSASKTVVPREPSINSPNSPKSQFFQNSLDKYFESSISNSAFTKLDGLHSVEGGLVNQSNGGVASIAASIPVIDSCLESWGISISALDKCMEAAQQEEKKEFTSENRDDCTEILSSSTRRQSRDLFSSSSAENSPQIPINQEIQESEDMFASFTTPTVDRVLRPRNNGSSSERKPNVSNSNLFSDCSRSPSLFGDSFEINTGLIDVLDGNAVNCSPVAESRENLAPAFGGLCQVAEAECGDNFLVPSPVQMRRKFLGPGNIDYAASAKEKKLPETKELTSPFKKGSIIQKSSNLHLGLSRRKLPKQLAQKEEEKLNETNSKSESKCEVLTDSFLEAAFQSAFDNDIDLHQATSPSVVMGELHPKVSKSSEAGVIKTSEEDISKETVRKSPESIIPPIVTLKLQEGSHRSAVVHDPIGPPRTRQMLARRQENNPELGNNPMEVDLNKKNKLEVVKNIKYKNPFHSIPGEDWSTYNIIDVCRSKVLFKTFSKEVLNTHTWSMSLACEHNEVTEPTVSIGSKILRTQKSSRQKSQLTSQLAFGDSVLVGVSFCFGSTDAYFLSLESECQSCVVSLNERLQLLQKVLSRDEAQPIPTVCCFDVKEQWKMLYRCAQIQMHHLSFCDPKIGDWLLEPEGKEKTFQAMVVKYAEEALSLADHAGQVRIGFSSPSLDTSQTIPGRQRCSVESILCFQIMSAQYELLHNANLLPSFLEVEMPVLVCVSIMELTGIGFNAETLHLLQEKIREEMSSLESKAYQLAGRTFSLTSPTDTARVLYQELRLGQNLSLRGKQRNTSKETLNKLRSEHPLPDIILLWRKLNAIHSKTVCPLLPSEPCSRLLGRYIMHTATGRISMHEPNIQCIPRDFEISPESTEPFCMRSAFVASEGNELVSADYSQLELRLLAHLSGEPKLQEILNCGHDVFCSLAASVNNISLDKVSDNLRQKAKQMCYGIIYGMGSRALADQLEVEESEAKTLMDTFHNAFPGIGKFLSKTVDQCCEQGFVKTLLERRRYLPGIASSNIHVKAHAERQAVNTTIQGSAADLTKTAMIAVEKSIYKRFPQALCCTGKEISLNVPRLVLHLHDELMYEVPKHCVDEFCLILKNGMESAIPLSIKFPVKIKVGKSWGALMLKENIF